MQTEVQYQLTRKQYYSNQNTIHRLVAGAVERRELWGQTFMQG